MNDYRQILQRGTLILVFCSCHHQNAASNSTTIPRLVREGWFSIR